MAAIRNAALIAALFSCTSAFVAVYKRRAPKADRPSMLIYASSLCGMCAEHCAKLDEGLLSQPEARSNFDIQMEFLYSEHHLDTCMNGTEEVLCTSLVDAAHLCAQKYEPDWWPFTACMFRHQTDLKRSELLGGVVTGCAKDSFTSSPNIAELERCYTSQEGNDLMAASHARSDAAGYTHPVWAFVGGVLISPDDYPSAAEWGAALLAQMETCAVSPQ